MSEVTPKENVDVDIAKKEVKVNLFKNLPIFFQCPHCGHSGHTIVDQKTTYISYIFLVMSIFIFGVFLSFFLMPLIILLTRNFIHRCSVCLAEVGSDNKLLGVANLEDKVITLSIGEFGMVLTRKIVLGALFTLVLIFTVYLQFDPKFHHRQGPVIKIDDTWESFITQCGRQQIHDGGARVAIACDQKYVERTVVNWKGNLIRVEDYRDSFMQYMHHAIALSVRMEPPETEYFPDLILALDTDRAVEFSALIATMDRGAEIIFNATIMTVGSEVKTRHFHVVEMVKGEGFKDIPAHVHEHGRYADKPKGFRGPAQLPGN